MPRNDHHCPGARGPVDGYPGNCRWTKFGIQHCETHMNFCMVHRLAYMKSKECVACARGLRLRTPKKPNQKDPRDPNDKDKDHKTPPNTRSAGSKRSRGESSGSSGTSASGSSGDGKEKEKEGKGERKGRAGKKGGRKRGLRMGGERIMMRTRSEAAIVFKGVDWMKSCRMLSDDKFGILDARFDVRLRPLGIV